MEEKAITEKESLQIITEMIRKAKPGINESGVSAILWGGVIAICGLLDFAQHFWNFSIGFDVWLLTLAAFIPQAFISFKESKQRTHKTHSEEAINYVWWIYTVSIFALVFYFNVVPSTTDKILQQNGAVVNITENGVTKQLHYFVPSAQSLLLLLYAIPTLATGLIFKFRPMTVGAIICYGFFLVSCFTESTYDALMNGLAGIFNWLVPGIILYKKRTSRSNPSLNV